MTNTTMWRISIILLFAIAFTLIGWTMPVIYASYVPQSEIIEVHEFDAEDTNTSADSHYICFDRTVHRPATATTFTELYLLSDSGERIEIGSSTSERYFQSGHDIVVTPHTLPEKLTPGTYRYVLIAEFNMAEGRVDRTFTFTSKAFTASDNISSAPPPEQAISSCG